MPRFSSFVVGLSAAFLTIQAVGQPTATPPVATSAVDSTAWRTPAPLGRQEAPGRPWRRALVAPGVLTGLGLVSLPREGEFSQYHTQHEIREHYPRFRTTIDDYLVWTPYLGISALFLGQQAARGPAARRLLWLTAKASATTFVVVHSMKTVTARLRPDGSARNSFPSGHAAQAFLGATLLDYEFRERAPWVGPVAYTVAGSVGVLRMFNNRHWQSDVLVGAALGIGIGKLACLTQRPRADGRPSALRVVPTWLPGAGAGLCLAWQPAAAAPPTMYRNR